MSKKYAIEFIGTFFLVLTIALTGNPLAIGAILIAMVYMGGYISGGHYNPAVTLAVYLTKKISLDNAKIYMIVQLLGAVAAALVFFITSGKTFVAAPGAGVSIYSAIMLEMLFTFALASVVLHTAVAEKNRGNHYYGLAIGLTVMAGAFAAGPISGGAFNPAVGVGPLLVDSSHITDHLTSLLIYTLGPFAGAAAAAFVYRLK